MKLQSAPVSQELLYQNRHLFHIRPARHIRLSIDTVYSVTWNLGQFQNPTYLAPGVSYSQTATVKIPRDFNGNYYLFVDANLKGFGNRTQQECNASNNRNRGTVPLSVTLSPYPDLQVSSVSPPANFFSGDTIKLNFTVRNAGFGTAADERLK